MNSGPYMVDTRYGRMRLLMYNAIMLFGKERIDQVLQEWNNICPNGLNEAIINIDKLNEFLRSGI